jgi:hypothetical protein
VERIWCPTGVAFLRFLWGMWPWILHREIKCVPGGWMSPCQCAVGLHIYPSWVFFDWVVRTPRFFLPRVLAQGHHMPSSVWGILAHETLETALSSSSWLGPSSTVSSFPSTPKLMMAIFPWDLLRKRERKLHLERRLFCTLFTTECKKSKLLTIINKGQQRRHGTAIKWHRGWHVWGSTSVCSACRL